MIIYRLAVVSQQQIWNQLVGLVLHDLPPRQQHLQIQDMVPAGVVRQIHPDLKITRSLLHCHIPIFMQGE